MEMSHLIICFYIRPSESALTMKIGRSTERILQDKKNRFDIALVSKDKNRLYLFKLKFLPKPSTEQQSVKIEEALKQIDDKEYSKYFKDISLKKTKIDVVGQDKTLSFKIEEIV